MPIFLPTLPTFATFLPTLPTRCHQPRRHRHMIWQPSAPNTYFARTIPKNEIEWYTHSHHRTGMYVCVAVCAYICLRSSICYVHTYTYVRTWIHTWDGFSMGMNTYHSYVPLLSNIEQNKYRTPKTGHQKCLMMLPHNNLRWYGVGVGNNRIC